MDGILGLIVRLFGAAILCMFAFAPAWIAFHTLADLLSNPGNFGLEAIIILAICLPMLYFLLLLAYRALTGRGRKEDHGLLPPWAMKGLAGLFILLGLAVVFIGIAKGDRDAIFGGVIFSIVALVAYRILSRKGDLIVVTNPRLGQFNILGSDAEQLVNSDRKLLLPLFGGRCTPKTDAPPKCDVLFVYAHVQDTGKIAGTTLSWRKIIRDSGARVVVMASENDSDAYRNMTGDTGYGYANFVLTMRRRGRLFAQFYWKLFKAMFAGKSMPIAWVKLAPQIPGRPHQDTPEGIFVAELGHLVFGKSA